jgi:TolB-like protein
VLVAAAFWWRDRARPELAEAPGPAVIVLPFEALSTDDDDHFLASGVTQELITDLMRFDGFRLYSVPASFRQEVSADPTDLGQDLGVDYVVKGTVRSDETTLRVGAQLFEAQTGEVLWGETYDRHLMPGDRLEIQSEVAANVATVLGQRYGVVNADMAVRFANGALPSMPSYACVLRAYEYHRTLRTDEHGPVLACLNDAVRRDAGYAEAWAMLAWLHLNAALFSLVPEAEAPQELDRALSFASEAVAADEGSVGALQALAAVNFHLGRFDEFERLERKALALNPNDPDTLAQLGWRLAVRGRWDEGLGYAQRAIDRTISPPGWYFAVVIMHLYLEGRHAEMLAYARRYATEYTTGSSLLAIAEAAAGNRQAARRALAKWADESPASARDPAAFFRRLGANDGLVDALVAGLRNAGWTAPEP